MIQDWKKKMSIVMLLYSASSEHTKQKLMLHISHIPIYIYVYIECHETENKDDILFADFLSFYTDHRHILYI